MDCHNCSRNKIHGGNCDGNRIDCTLFTNHSEDNIDYNKLFSGKFRKLYIQKKPTEEENIDV